MIRQKLTGVALVAVLAGLTTLAGCTQQTTTSRPTTRAANTSREVDALPDPVDTRRLADAGWPTRRSDADTNWIALAYPTGDASTSAVGMEKSCPREVRVGVPWTTTIVVCNLTANTLSDVVVVETFGANYQHQSSTPNGRVEGDEVMWVIGSMAPHECKEIMMTGTARGEGSTGSCTEITYESVLCCTIPVVQPALAVTKTGPAEVLKCDEIVYNFEVSNTGSGYIDNVVVSDQLPAGLTHNGRQSISFDAGRLDAGQSKTFQARIAANRSGTFENSATASGEGGINASSGTVTTVVKAPKLVITKECRGTQFIGRPLDYTITVRNTGDGPARDTIVTDTLPAGCRFVSASDGGTFSGGTVTWNGGTMAPGAAKSMTMRVMPDAAGSYRNAVTARAYCADPVSDDCVTEVTGIPAILLEVVDLQDPVEVGTETTYVITATNQGTAVDTSISIVCQLEANQAHVSNSGATRGTVAGQRITFAPLPRLEAGQKATWRVVVRATSGGDTRFTVVLNTDELQRPVQETESTNLYE